MPGVIFQYLVENHDVIHVCFNKNFEKFQQFIDLFLDARRVVFEFYNYNVPLFIIFMINHR